MDILLNSISNKWSSFSLSYARQSYRMLSFSQLTCFQSQILSLFQKGTWAHTLHCTLNHYSGTHGSRSSNHEIQFKQGKFEKFTLCRLLYLQSNLSCSPLTRQGWVQVKNATRLISLNLFAKIIVYKPCQDWGRYPLNSFVTFRLEDFPSEAMSY